ncbi:autotransporter domain-containing protein [Corticibacterium sp. UT-5YL-CI-8]|nr:autotransporter domain-containing protein [Tianweitania sp. UT-5YL-CI-8]
MAVATPVSALAQERLLAPLEYTKINDVPRLVLGVSTGESNLRGYILDTGSSAFVGQFEAVGTPVGEPTARLYGDATYGNLVQQVELDDGLYYKDDKGTVQKLTGSKKAVVSKTVDIIYAEFSDAAEGKRLSDDPVYIAEDGTRYFADLDAREAIAAGKPAESDGTYGTLGAGDFIAKDLAYSALGDATASGFIVAANVGDLNNNTAPGCGPCVVMNLDPSLRAQFDNFVPWQADHDTDDATKFPVSGANASTQFEGAYQLNFKHKNPEKDDVSWHNISVLLDTGTPGGGSLSISQDVYDKLVAGGVKFTKSKGAIYLNTLEISAPDGTPIPVGQVDVTIDKEGKDKFQFIAGLDFFLNASVMYDLKNQATAYTTYLVTADNFTTDAGEPRINNITPEMGASWVRDKLDADGQPILDKDGNRVQETYGQLGIAGVISGGGGLTIARNAELRLTNTNTYEGETRIEKGGKVELTGPGSIENSARLVNDGTLDIQSKGNSLEGWGVPDKFNDARIRSLAGSGDVLLLNRTLVLTDARDTFAGVISDFDAENKHASGKLSVLGGVQTLGGQNSFTGLTTVGSGAGLLLSDTGTLAGEVSVSGLFGNDGDVAGETTVKRGGTAAGTGTFGGLTVAQGGTVAPGTLNDSGEPASVLTVDGDFVQQDGSTYLAGIAPGNDPDKAADRIAVTGGATIDSGASVELVRQGAGQFALDTRYTLLTAAQGVDGTYGGLTGDLHIDSPFVDFGLAYDVNNVYLDVDRSTVAFADVGTTFNQRSVAAASEALGSGNAIYDNALFLTEGGSRAAFDLLSGEVHASAKGALIEGSHFVRGAASERIRAAFAGVGASSAPVTTLGSDGMKSASATTEKLAVWGRGFGAWGRQDGDGNAVRLDYSTGGFLGGADALVAETWRVGVLAGYSRTSFDVDDRRSSGSSDNYHLGAFAGTQWDRLGFRSGLVYTWHRLDSRRSVSFTGLSDTLSSDYDAGTFQAFGELGYRIDTAAVALEPYANLAYVHLNTDGFGETGGAAALHGSDQSTDTTFGTLGLRASSAFSLGSMSATAHGGIGWRHTFGDVTPMASMAFANGAVFDVRGAPIAKNAALVEAGLELDLTARAALGLTYQGQIASDSQEHGFNAKLAVRF